MKPKRNWGLVTRGIIAVIIGLIAVFWPGVTLGILVILFAAFALLDGAIGITMSIVSARQKERWWPFLIEGILGLVIGLIAIVWPEVTLVVLIYLIALWALVTGAFELVAALTVDWVPGARWFLGIAGAFSVVLSILLFFYPLAGAQVIVLLLGIYAIAFGIVLLVTGFRARKEIKEVGTQ